MTLTPDRIAILRHLANTTRGEDYVSSICSALSLSSRDWQASASPLSSAGHIMRTSKPRSRAPRFAITPAGRAALASPPPAPKSGVRLRVVQGHMVPGAGNRDETCAKYIDCLDAFVAAYRGDPDGHCKWGCRFYEEREEPSALGYTSSGVSNMRDAVYVTAT